MARKGGNPDGLVNFKKGHDPRRNVNGRPKKIPELDILLADILCEESKNGIEAARAILMALREKAVKGDVRAAELLMDRAWGKAKQYIQADGTLNGILNIQVINPEDINEIDKL